MEREYALYKGEEILAIGTIADIAKETGVKERTVSYYKTQAYQNRLERRNALNGNIRILVSLEGEDEEEI